MTIENMISDYVYNHNINKASLARSIGMTTDAFYHVIRGRRKIKGDELVKFCHEIGVSVDEFIENLNENN